MTWDPTRPIHIIFTPRGYADMLSMINGTHHSKARNSCPSRVRELSIQEVHAVEEKNEEEIGKDTNEEADKVPLLGPFEALEVTPCLCLWRQSDDW
ncbi:hypothetical protein AMTR_s00130p00034380 [Amborella trichopoda]|uniref:Uncharacterized protein n=1 Tax=Amborella trichopoda TaxID=13333 RepID=W1NQD4_AMBTC|nr:hypothetical protein AMTR_s00130p00034380 [Amborella trichopoda]